MFLTHTLKTTLKLLHPFMPFITEEIFLSFEGKDESIMISDWPEAEDYGFASEAQAMENVMQLIRTIRNIRAEMNVPPSKKARLLILADEQGRDIIGMCEAYLKKTGLCLGGRLYRKQGNRSQERRFGIEQHSAGVHARRGAHRYTKRAGAFAKRKGKRF